MSEPLSLSLEPDSLRALVREVVREVVEQLGRDRAALPGGRLAWSEPEAAALLSLRPHQLRDERLRGRLQASVGPGRKVLYSREDLLGYLSARRTGG